MKTRLRAILFLSLLVFSGQSFADAITCGSDDRTATLDSAEECFTGRGNPHADDVQDHSGGDPWRDVGHIDDDTTLNEGFLSIVFAAGSFLEGERTSVELDWTIADEFWDTFAEAVITIHVGNGGADPDHFAWLITEGETSGTLSYDRLRRGGGGFSNIVLWGRGDSVSVPEPGTLALLGAGLLVLGFSRRRRTTIAH